MEQKEKQKFAEAVVEIVKILGQIDKEIKEQERQREIEIELFCKHMINMEIEEEDWNDIELELSREDFYELEKFRKRLS